MFNFNFLKSKKDISIQPDPPHKRSRSFSTRVQNLGNRISKVFERNSGDEPELRNDVENAHEDERKLKDMVRELNAEITKVKQRLNQRASQREESKRVTKELAVAQKFLSTADSLSQAEVVRAMEALNEEIFQLTSIVADKVQVTERHLQEPERREMFRERVLSVGPLAEFLQVVEHQHLEDSLAIQIGWQAILVHWCSAIIQAWFPADLQLNKDFNELYINVTSQSEARRILVLSGTNSPQMTKLLLVVGEPFVWAFPMMFLQTRER